MPLNIADLTCELCHNPLEEGQLVSLVPIESGSGRTLVSPVHTVCGLALLPDAPQQVADALAALQASIGSLEFSVLGWIGLASCSTF